MEGKHYQTQNFLAFVKKNVRFKQTKEYLLIKIKLSNHGAGEG